MMKCNFLGLLAVAREAQPPRVREMARKDESYRRATRARLPVRRRTVPDAHWQSCTCERQSRRINFQSPSFSKFQTCAEQVFPRVHIQKTLIGIVNVGVRLIPRDGIRSVKIYIPDRTLKRRRTTLRNLRVASRALLANSDSLPRCLRILHVSFVATLRVKSVQTQRMIHLDSTDWRANAMPPPCVRVSICE